MNKLIIALLIAFATACAARQAQPTTELDALRKQLAQQANEIALLKQAASEGHKPTAAPTSPNTAAQATMNGGGVPAAAILVSSLPPSFPGVYGTEPRHLTIGPYLKLENMICDGGYDMGANCRDADGNGGPDYNYAVAYWIEGKPAGCGNGFQMHGDGPCWIEIGRLRKFTLTVRRYRLTGTPQGPKVNLSSDDGAYTTVINTYGGNVTRHQANEHPFL